MTSKIEKLGGNMVRLTVEIEAAEFDKACVREYDRRRGEFNVQGFRKGRAPRKVIEKMYGESVFYQGAMQALVNETYSRVLDENGIEAAAEPELLVEPIVRGSNVIYTALVPAFVDVKLGQYMGVRISKGDTSVSDEEVMAQIMDERKRTAPERKITSRPVEMGDIIYLDFEGRIDNTPFDGGQAADYRLEVGSNTFIPGFEEQLVGVMPGERVFVNVTFPADYSAAHLAGKKANFQCKVNSIAEVVEPALDDAFAKDQGYDSMDAYKAGVREMLENAKAVKVKMAMQEEALDRIIENAELEVPAAAVKKQLDEIRNEQEQQLNGQGLSMEMYLDFSGMTMDELDEMNTPNAIRQIKVNALLKAIADAEEVTVSEDQIAAEFDRMANNYSMTTEEIKKVLGDYGRSEVEKNLRIENAIKLIMDNVIVE